MDLYIYHIEFIIKDTIRIKIGATMGEVCHPRWPHLVGSFISRVAHLSGGVHSSLIIIIISGASLQNKREFGTLGGGLDSLSILAFS